MAARVTEGRNERFADVRFARAVVRAEGGGRDVASIANITETFTVGLRGEQYGSLPQGRAVEVVTLRVRRTGPAAEVRLPTVTPAPAERRPVSLVDDGGATVAAAACTRAGLLAAGPTPGPVLLVDPTATAFVPAGWTAAARDDGTVVAERSR